MNIIWIIILFVLVVTSLIILYCHFIYTNYRLNHVFRLDDKLTYLSKKNTNGSSSVSFQKDRHEYISKWCSMVENAQTEILLSTYTWETCTWENSIKNENKINPQILYMGNALKNRQDKHYDINPLKFWILLSKKMLFSRQLVMQKTIDIWKSQGVNLGDTSIWDFQVRTFSQERAGHCHIKFTIFDEQKVLVSSTNIEHTIHNGPPRWGESSLCVVSRKTSQKTKKYFMEELWTHKRRSVKLNINYENSVYVYKNIKLSTSFNSNKLCLFEREYDAEKKRLQDKQISVPETNINILLSTCANSLWNTTWAPSFKRLLFLIQNCKSQIYIFTPNFNDKTIWTYVNEACRRGVKCNIMTGKYFNHRSSFSKYAIGWRSNLDMFTNVVLPSVQNNNIIKQNLIWKWYGFNNKLFTSVLPRQAHDKIFIIDNTVICGSFNCTVISSFNASECSLEVNSTEFKQYVWETFGKNHWNNGINQLF